MLVVPNTVRRNLGFVSVLAIGLHTMLTINIEDTNNMLEVYMFGSKLLVCAYVLAVTARDFISLLVTKNPGYVSVRFEYFVQCMSLGLYACYCAGAAPASTTSTVEFLVTGGLGIMCIVHAWDCVYYGMYS